jgi:hypothetical protein
MADKNQISWTASEYIDHERGGNWYFALVVSTVVLSAVSYVLFKDLFAAIIIFALGIVVAIASKRKPEQLSYNLDENGLQIGHKAYPYSRFHSFAIITQGALKTLELFPNKKFMPPISAFFEAADEEVIVNIVGEHLPLEQRSQDKIDALSRRLRL